MLRTLGLLTVLLIAGCGGDRMPFTGNVVSFEPAEEPKDNRIRVFFEIRNDGSKPAKGQCRFRAYDEGVDQRDDIGSRTFDTKQKIQPGEIYQGSGEFVINEDADEVRRVEAQLCRQTGMPWLEKPGR